jgi:hypothetical protein
MFATDGRPQILLEYVRRISFMSNKLRLLSGIITIFVLQFIVTNSAHAVPAFSRANKVECTTCHTIAPELNEYGVAFLKNSYVYIGKGNKTAKKSVPTPAPVAAPVAPSGDAPKVMGEGDSAKLSKLKAGAMGAGAATQATDVTPVVSASADLADSRSEGMVLAGIPEQLPISFTGSINYATGDNNAKIATGGTNVDFTARSFKLHAAGNFRDTIGFFATYVAYSEQPPVGVYNTSVTASNNKTDINEMFVQWRQVLDSPVNIKFGRFQPKLGLWKTNDKLSTTYNYLPYSYSVGYQSVFRIDQPQDAIELNSILAKRLFLAAGIVNRKGQDNKEGYGHISYKFGGADYKGNEPDVDLSKDESILDFLTMTVGTYGYWGKNGSNIAGTNRNIFGRAGIDTELQYKIFRLRALGGWGIDDNANPAAIAYWPTVVSKAATIEGEFTLRTNLITAARFEYLQEVGNVPKTVFINQYIRRYVATIGYTPLENFKVSSEFKYEITQNEINRLGTLGATFSF